MPQAEAAPDPALLKKWQDMSQNLIAMQKQMVQMQEDMNALAAQMLTEGNKSTYVAPVSRTMPTGNPAAGVTVRGAAAATAGGETLGQPVGRAPEIAQGVTVRTEAEALGAASGTTLSSKELENLGRGLEGDAERTGTSDIADEDKKAEDQNLRFNGEVRYGYLRNRGGDDNRFDNNDSQLRVRLYAHKMLNEDWGVHGMWEGKKHFLSDSDDDITSGSRLYVEGLTGTTTITAGKFGYLMADGNIYDSEFRGIKATVKDTPWTYTGAVGKTSANATATVGSATYTGDNYDAEVGVYKFTDDDYGYDSNSIMNIGANYYLDQVTLGAMWLGSDDNTDTTGKNGYVLSARYRTMKSWKPGSWSLYSKYYNQPWSTYRNHTMNGLGNSMHGFKGYVVGVEYAIAPEIAANIEYYKLTDKRQGDSVNTFWGAINYNF